MSWCNKLNKYPEVYKYIRFFYLFTVVKKRYKHIQKYSKMLVYKKINLVKWCLITPYLISSENLQCRQICSGKVFNNFWSRIWNSALLNGKFILEWKYFFSYAKWLIHLDRNQWKLEQTENVLLYIMWLDSNGCKSVNKNSVNLFL